MKAKFLYLAIFGLMIVSFLMLWQMPAQMQASRTDNPIDSQKINDTTSARTSPASKPDELIEKASRNGSARVIVGLRVDFQTGGALSESTQNRRRDQIKRAQSNLLDDLTNYRVTGVKRFEFIPFLAAEADAAALENL
jgi:hypothetical protein